MPHENDEIPVDRLVAIFIKMRANKKARASAHKKEIADIDRDMRMIENELLRRANVQGTEGFTTKAGTTYKDLVLKASIADATQFHAFAEQDPDPWSWTTTRIPIDKLKAYLKAQGEEATNPPGLNVFPEYRMKIRAKNARKGIPLDDIEEDNDDNSSDDD